MAKVQQVFRFSGGKSTVVAGLIVQSGRLRNKAVPVGGGSASSSGSTSSSSSSAADPNAGGFVFRVWRNGEIILSESKGGCDLKKFKTVVHEVSSI